MISMWTYMRLRQPEPQGALIAQGRESVVFPLEKPPVKLPAESALIWRGQSGTEKEKLLADLGAALAFYRKDDYDTAARYLEQFTRQYPDSAEGHFYLGISLIFRERNTEAASALENAKRLAAGPLARDARWYLGLAYQREGKTALALAEWQELCANGGEYQSKACSAAQQLSPR
jgi:TolA-binding protein